MPFEVSNERSIMLAHNSHLVPVSLVALMRHNYSGTQGINTLLVAYVKAGLFLVQKLQQCQCNSCLVCLDVRVAYCTCAIVGLLPMQ